MTMHYGDTVTAQDVIWGWKSHGQTMPGAYATITWGDTLAYNCWTYLHHLRRETQPMPTPEEFFEKIPENRREESIQILKETIEEFRKMELTKE